MKYLYLGLLVLLSVSCGGKTSVGGAASAGPGGGGNTLKHWTDQQPSGTQCANTTGNSPSVLGNWTLHQSMGADTQDVVLGIDPTYSVLVTTCKVGGRSAVAKAQVTSHIDSNLIHLDASDVQKTKMV